MKRQVIAACLVIAAATSSAHAWWDTVVASVRSAPLIQEIEAESVPGVPANQIVDDPQSNGGAGGKAVVLTPDGPGISFDLDVKPGVYGIFAITRLTDKPNNLGIVTLKAKELATGQTRSWTMPFVSKDTYFSGIMAYFPADVAGKYTLTLQLESDIAKLHAERWGYKGKLDPYALPLLDSLKASKFGPVQVDRIEIRDVLGPKAVGPITQTKQRRMLTTDAQLAALRSDFAKDPQAEVELTTTTPKFKVSKAPAWFTAGRKPEERSARNDEIWNILPDYNTPLSQRDNAWTVVMGKNLDGMTYEFARAYELTGNTQCAYDGALLLLAVAQKYPAVDYLAMGTPLTANLTSEKNSFQINNPPGKELGRGWAGRTAVTLINSYDKLYDFIKDNKEFAAEASRRIPGISTPDDVIKYLDTHILRHIADAANRDMIEGNDAPKALAPLVLGPGPDSDKMLRDGIFNKISMNLTHRGGIDDHAVCTFSRDGVHYIGAVSYLKDDLMEIGQLLRQYRLAGGNPAFDITEANPHMEEAQKTLAQLYMGGGYRILQGDGGDLRFTRSPENDIPFPSHVLGGFGMSVLETGQFQPDDVLKRGLSIYFGIGRGHSQQDTLTLEMVAHGARVSPDLGGRQEQKFRGWPDMRDNRVHNLVEVDDTNFCNPINGSTTSGTGWNTGFFSAPGIQFLEHHARATSHPQVTNYARQTTLIDVPASGQEGDSALINSGDSYVFDVFRVTGGKTQTYCFHGVPTTDFSINTPLSPTIDKDAETYLAEHFKGSQRQGVAPAMLQADWPMEQDLQKRYQGAQYKPELPLTTRIALFGLQGQGVLIGNAYSTEYKYNFPFLYVRSHQERDGLQNVYPAIIEPFVAKPFIQEKRQLTVTPAQSGSDAAVAIEVKTTSGTTDTLYASGHPETAVDLQTGARMDGKFAIVSTDASGLRAAQLVGGTTLTAPGISIQVPAGQYRAPITSVDYLKRSFTVPGTLPTQLLAGQWVGLVNPAGLTHTFKLESLQQQSSQTVLTHEKSARYYQSNIVSRDDATQGVECEIEPPVYNADPNFINGTTVSNEAGDKFAHVSIHEDDHWMHIGWPGYRTSYPQTIAWQDIPDTDGDGKHTLTMTGKRHDIEQAPYKIQVTRIEKDGQTFYFKLPENEPRRGGWDFVDLRLANESGTKTWRSIYPGISYRWVLDAASKMKVADFTDVNADGKTKLIAYLFGPGDQMVMDRAVHIRRIQPGLFCLQTNTPCTITLAAGSAKTIAISSDNKTFKDHPTTQKSDQLTIDLTESDLANGTIWLKLAP